MFSGCSASDDDVLPELVGFVLDDLTGRFGQAVSNVRPLQLLQGLRPEVRAIRAERPDRVTWRQQYLLICG
jgi:hypothetical protein